MFGYININGSELNEEGKKAYQSYYCGLCDFDCCSHCQKKEEIKIDNEEKKKIIIRKKTKTKDCIIF